MASKLFNAAMNGAMNGMMNTNPQVKQLMQMVNEARSCGNPEQYIAKLLQSNPKAAQQIMSMLQSGNIENVGKDLLAKNGLTINDIK